MAFAYTKDGQSVIGNKMLVWGTFTNGAGDTGGDVYTGLNTIEAFWLQPKSSSVIASAAVVNETFPLATDGVTIVNTADEDGYWYAIGTG